MASAALSVESFAVGFAGFVCMFYGVLGVARVCTSDCSNVKVSEQGRQVNFTPAMAAFACSLAIISGFFIFRFRGFVGAITEGISTFGSELKTKTVEGQQSRQSSIKFAVLFSFVFVVVVVFVKFTLLKPLDACPPLDIEEVPMMTAVRAALEKMEPWVVGSGFAFLGLGFLLCVSETVYREGYAERVERGESTENYDLKTAIKENLSILGNRGVTLKSTQENLLNRPMMPMAPQSFATPASAVAAPTAQVALASPHSVSSSSASSARPSAANASDLRKGPQRSGARPNLISRPYTPPRSAGRVSSRSMSTPLTRPPAPPPLGSPPAKRTSGTSTSQSFRSIKSSNYLKQKRHSTLPPRPSFLPPALSSSSSSSKSLNSTALKQKRSSTLPRALALSSSSSS